MFVLLSTPAGHHLTRACLGVSCLVEPYQAGGRLRPTCFGLSRTRVARVVFGFWLLKTAYFNHEACMNILSATCADQMGFRTNSLN